MTIRHIYRFKISYILIIHLILNMREDYIGYNLYLEIKKGNMSIEHSSLFLSIKIYINKI
jgi:hypothetical protein